MTVLKNKRIVNQLSKLGLSEDAANIYTFLLEVGSEKTKNTAFYIAKHLSIPRSTAYLNLDRLISSNLVSTYSINNVKHFLAEHPKRLSHDLEEKKHILLELLPDLEELRKNAHTYSSVRTYSGDAGVKLVFDEIFDATEIKKFKDILAISNTKLSKILPRNLPKKLDAIKKRHNIHTKMIVVPGAESSLDNVYTNDSHRETRFLPSHYEFEGSVYVYGEKVAFFSLSEKELYSVIIESKTISSMIRNFFLCTWDLLE